jgi:acyl-coenzyme A thioesterase PaaI-like protein
MTSEPSAPLLHAQATGEVRAAATFDLTTMRDPGGHTLEVHQGVPVHTVDGRGALATGALCLVADHSLGGAAMSRISADERMVTSHMHLEIVAEPTPNMRSFCATADEVHLAPGSAFIRGRISADDGTLVALTSARFALFDASRAQGGNVAPLATAPASSVVADLGGWTRSPVDDLLGLSLVRLHPAGGIDVAFRATPELSNERSGLHGGVGALMAERAADLVLRLGDDQSPVPFRPVELRVAFLRPIAADGNTVGGTAEVTFRGATTAATTSRVYRPDGKVSVQLDAVHVRATR